MKLSGPNRQLLGALLMLLFLALLIINHPFR